MQRNTKLGLGLALAVAAVGAHYAHWWLSTQEMQKQLATYVEHQKQQGTTIGYTAVAAGYPWSRQLKLSNVVISNTSNNGDRATEVRITDGLVLSAGNGVTNSTLTLNAINMPMDVAVVDHLKNPIAPPQKLTLHGRVGSLHMQFPLTWNPDNTNVVTSLNNDISLATEAKDYVLTVGSISNTLRISPENDTSLDNRMTLKDAAIQLTDTTTTPPLAKSAKVSTLNFGVALDHVSSSAPELQTFMVNASNFETAGDAVDSEGKPVKESTKAESASVSLGTSEHDNLLNYLMTLKLNNMAVRSAKTPLIGDIDTLTCSLSYTNVPKTLADVMRKDAAVPEQLQRMTLSPEVASALLDALVTQKMSISIDNCQIASKGLTGDVKGLLNATPDGYPSVMLLVKAKGESVVGLNALKNIMLPAASVGTEPAPSDTLDISLLSISNTLVLDGKPLIPLPPLTDVLGTPNMAALPPQAVTATMPTNMPGEVSLTVPATAK